MSLAEEIRERIDDALVFVEKNKPGYPLVIKYNRGNYIMAVDVSTDDYDDAILMRLDELGYEQIELCSDEKLKENNIDLNGLITGVDSPFPIEVW